MFSQEEIDVLEDVLNEELLGYLHSGYSLEDAYAINIRNIMQKLGIKERYNFERYRES